MNESQLQRVRERFNSKVEVLESGCHKWTASLKNSGYGNFTFATGMPMDAHRAAWILDGREPPEKPFVFDHLCNNRWCVNVEHLQIVTYSENTLRSNPSQYRRPDQTKCRSGRHDWVPENLVVVSGGTTCRPCRDEKHHEYLRKQVR